MGKRVFRTAKGYWGFGLSKWPGGWSLQFGPWCFNTPYLEDDE